MQLSVREILIRADGSSSIGLGHLVRCLALAHMLREEFNIRFVCISVPQDIKNEIIASGFALQMIVEEVDWISNLRKGDIVVVDHYGFGTSEQIQIKQMGSTLVCIDDLHDKRFFADLIINHTPGIQSRDYRAAPYTEFALGLDYVLLRPAFLAAATQNKRNHTEGTIFICFGGADHLNHTQNVLEVVMTYKEFNRIIVVVGSGYLFTKELQELVAKNEVIELYQSLEAAAVLTHLMDAAIAIVPASGILLEALVAKCKVISGMYVENQKLLFKAYKDQGIITSAGDFSTRAVRIALAQVVHQAPQKMGLIDGQSGIRLLRCFKLLAQEADCSLRPAMENDLQTTYDWARNKTIRAFSFSQKDISFEEHENWFNKKIADASCHYLIFEQKGKPAGTFRLDLQGEQAIISYFLDPSFHGNGLGTVLLKKGVDWLFKLKDPNVKSVYGDVMDNNVPSIKAFEKLNFTKSFPKEGVTRFTKLIYENQQ